MNASDRGIVEWVAGVGGCKGVVVDRIVVIVNPQRRDVVDRLTELLGSDVEQLTPERPDDIPHAVERAVDAGARVVAAVGGDGTQRTVAASLAGTSARLAVIPGGTVNLLAQVLGLDELDAAAAAATSGAGHSIDVATCNGETFLLNASSGYDAAVIERADGALKRRLGRMGFVVAAVDRLRGLRSTRVTVDVEGARSYDGRAATVIVTNVAQRSSDDVILAPGAAIDDGVLHILVVRRASVASMTRVVRAVLRRKPLRREDALRLTGTTVSVVWARPVAGQIDGDPTGTSRRFEHVVDAGALDVCR